MILNPNKAGVTDTELNDLPVIPITSAEYDALTDAEKQAEVAYLIYDGGSSWWSPKMTGDTTPAPYVASASSNSSNTAYKPYLAFNGEPSASTTTVGSWSSAENAGSAYVQLNIGFPIVVARVRVNPSYNAEGIMTPSNLFIQVSDDGTDWNTVAEFTGITWPALGKYKEFSFEKPVQFSFCRIGANNVPSGETVRGRISYGDIQFFKTTGLTSIEYKGATIADAGGASFKTDDTLTNENNVLGVATPVQGIVTEAEFDALPEAQRNKGFYVISGGGGSSLQSLSITKAPDKVSYKVGDTFDPTGMEATATFSGGATLSVSASNLTFSPSGALAVTDTSVTVSFTFGGKTVSASQAITVSAVSIYGASWDGTATTKWSRTDDSADFVDPVPYVAGSTNYGSPFDTLQPWAGMTIEERTGGKMVKIPKFWYKLTQNGAGLDIKIADSPVEGFVTSPAHMDRGDGKGERDVVYIGRYHCASDFKSKTGVLPKVSTTRADFRTGIHTLGANIWQSDFAMRFTLWLLYLVEFADWNTQKTIGKGCGNNSAAQSMGYTDSMPYHTGTTQSNRDTYGLGTQYRNIEGLWDNCYDFCDGCYNNSNGLNIILNPNNYSDSSGGTSVGTPTSGYPTAFNVVNQAGFPMIIPTSTTGGGENVASCDSWCFGAGDPVIFVGGYYVQHGSRGLFFVYCTFAAYAGSYLGSRLHELP